MLLLLALLLLLFIIIVVIVVVNYYYYHYYYYYYSYYYYYHHHYYYILASPAALMHLHCGVACMPQHEDKDTKCHTETMSASIVVCVGISYIRRQVVCWRFELKHRNAHMHTCTSAHTHTSAHKINRLIGHMFMHPPCTIFRVVQLPLRLESANLRRKDRLLNHANRPCAFPMPTGMESSFASRYSRRYLIVLMTIVIVIICNDSNNSSSNDNNNTMNNCNDNSDGINVDGNRRFGVILLTAWT